MSSNPAEVTASAPATQRRTSGMAVTSMILGILGILSLFGVGWFTAGIPSGILSLIAVILGHTAMGKVKHSAGTIDGKGLAVAGVVMGWIVLGLSILFFLFGMLFLIGAAASA